MKGKSQHGEDAQIQRIFSAIGTANNWCVELGALNGRHDSNAWLLIKEKNWSGVLIEADPTYFEQLTQEYAEIDRAHCINAFVSFEGENSLDNLLVSTPIPKDFDLLSLDIDGNEYHVWDSLSRYRPRLVVVEFNPSMPNELSFVQPRDMKVFQGSSALALVELAKRKGYELIATNKTNAFFVLKELFPKLQIADNSLDALRTDHRYETKLYQLYDGTLKITGNTELMWHKLPIDEEKLQVLPKHKRVYPARISDSGAVRSFKYWARRLPLYSLIQKIRSYLR